VGREDGAPAALVTLAADATPDEREKLGRALTALRAAGDSLEGVLPVRAIAESGDAFLTDLWTLGTARDLPALRWPLQRRLAFVGKVARSIEALHAAGIVHGCLGLDNVLLDDDLQPVLSEVSLVDLRNVVAADPSSPYARSAPPELTTVGRVTASGDLFAIGRLLEDLVSPEERALPLVAELVMGTVAPEGSRFSDAGKLAQGIQAAVSEVSIADGISTVLAPATAPRPRKPAAAEPTPHRRRRKGRACRGWEWRGRSWRSELSRWRPSSGEATTRSEWRSCGRSRSAWPPRRRSCLRFRARGRSDAWPSPSGSWGWRSW
jgi:serine/threonine protein kinase